VSERFEMLDKIALYKQTSFLLSFKRREKSPRPAQRLDGKSKATILVGEFT